MESSSFIKEHIPTSPEDPAAVAVIGAAGGGLAAVDRLLVGNRRELLASKGLILVDPSPLENGGNLTGVLHQSNSPYPELADVFSRHEGGVNKKLGELFETFCQQYVTERARRTGLESLAVPLEWTSILLAEGRRQILELLSPHLRSGYLSARVEEVEVLQENSQQLFVLKRPEGEPVFAQSVVFATGSRLEPLAGLEPYGFGPKGKVISSLQAATQQGVDRILDQILRVPFAERKIAIIGGKDSAAIAPKVLLEKLGKDLPPGAISVFHRAPRINLFFETQQEEAETLQAIYGHRWRDFRGPVCPSTERVHRWTGVREDARRFVIDVLKKGKASEKVSFRSYHGDLSDPEFQRQHLDPASSIIQACGWKVNAIPVKGSVQGPQLFPGNSAAKIDAQSRICDANGNPIEQAYGIGFGWGRDPRGWSGKPDQYQVVALNANGEYAEGIANQIVDHLITS